MPKHSDVCQYSRYKEKEAWQLRKLKAMGINGLSIGTESGDDTTLALANKGYTAADIIEQCKKLDEAGIELCIYDWPCQKG